MISVQRGDQAVAAGLTMRSASVTVCVPQEAHELSSLKPQLEELGVPLVAVVKENIGTEIRDFGPHFAGDIFIDEQVGAANGALPPPRLSGFG